MAQKKKSKVAAIKKMLAAISYKPVAVQISALLYDSIWNTYATAVRVYENEDGIWLAAAYTSQPTPGSPDPDAPPSGSVREFAVVEAKRDDTAWVIVTPTKSLSIETHLPGVSERDDRAFAEINASPDAIALAHKILAEAIEIANGKELTP